MSDIHLGSYRANDGLDVMMTAALGEQSLVHTWVSVETALLIVAVARVAPDHPEWFPCGKWATIQVIQARIDEWLATVGEELKKALEE